MLKSKESRSTMNPIVITLNMINKGKKPIIGEHSSDNEIDEPYYYTWLKAGVTTPRNNRRLSGGSDKEDTDHLAIASSRSYGSSWNGEPTAHVLDNSSNIDHKIEAWEWLIQE